MNGGIRREGIGFEEALKMADEVIRRQTSRDPKPVGTDDPTPAPVDPGGAHAKGYSADPGSNETVQEPDPVPLAPGPNTHSAVRVPERDDHVNPTGRKEPPDDEPIEI